MKGLKGFPNGLGHESAQGVFVAKANLPLLRVYVDVDGGGVNFEEETTDREPTLHEDIVVALQKREVESPILHGSLIHKQKLFVPGRAGHPRSSQKTPNSKGRSGR